MHLYELCEEFSVPSCKCDRCGKTAMYFANGLGFCREHRAEAVEEQKKVINETFPVH